MLLTGASAFANEPVPADEPPASFRALSISYVALNGADAVTTIRALNNRHLEGNPLVAPLASNPPALIAVKAASSVAAVYMAERLWKRNRRAAVVTMVALNALMSSVVVRNAAIGGRRVPPQ